ncbi:MAG: IS4 family transposase [Desulfatirhabdiaceae bacterium]|nr:IS4 family transposase [Desulfatirhabdiaceae bacterium]
MLARNLLCEICAKLIDFLKKIIFSENFLSSNKQSPKNFIRNRILPFHNIIFFLMNLIKGSYQDELDYFFKAIDHSEAFVRKVTKSAFCKARKKLRSEAFTQLNMEAVNYFYDHFSPKRWSGFTLLAIDGSTVKIPRTSEVENHFGLWSVNSQNPCPLARISQMFDVLNKITVDAIIAPKAIGERELCENHFMKLMPNDLVLLDRGYPAYWLFNLILSWDGNFCARVQVDKWIPIKKFFRSGKLQKIIQLKAPTSSIAKCRELGLDTLDLKLRLIRIQLENGETEVLITSLIDTEKYPLEIFFDLYHHRWPVEEDYKVMKCRIEIENFTGKSVLSVYQDFHARIFSKNLTAMLAFPTRRDIEQNNDDKLHQYQINFTQAISKMKDTIVLLFNRPLDVAKNLIAALHDLFVKTVEPVRPNRKYPRNHKIQKRGFYPSYKPVR